jgi:hypothetical protein
MFLLKFLRGATEILICCAILALGAALLGGFMDYPCSTMEKWESAVSRPAGYPNLIFRRLGGADAQMNVWSRLAGDPETRLKRLVGDASHSKVPGRSGGGITPFIP